MSLQKEKTSRNPSLLDKSYGIAGVNMVFGAILLVSIDTVRAIISGIRENVDFSAVDLGMVFISFIALTLIRIIVVMIPTIIGAKGLRDFLQHRTVTQKSAMIAGAPTGILVISMLTILISICVVSMGPHGILPSLQSDLGQFAVFAICAALAGGRTGLQLAKSMEAQNQNPVEVQL